MLADASSPAVYPAVGRVLSGEVSGASVVERPLPLCNIAVTCLLAQLGLKCFVVGLVDEIGLAGALVAQRGQQPGQPLADIGKIHRRVV
jgi:hypothetical protein